MEELNGVNLLNLSSRSKPKQGKKKSTTIKIPSQHRIPPPKPVLEKMKRVISQQRTELASLNDQAVPLIFLILSHKTHVRLFLTRKRKPNPYRFGLKEFVGSFAVYDV